MNRANGKALSRRHPGGLSWYWHLFSGVNLMLLSVLSSADSHDLEALQKVESLRCGNVRLAQRMEDQAQIHSRRDLGWRFYPGENYVDVERAMRVSKSLEIHYRWRVSTTGTVEAISTPAQKLCE